MKTTIKFKKFSKKYLRIKLKYIIFANVLTKISTFDERNLDKHIFYAAAKRPVIIPSPPRTIAH